MKHNYILGEALNSSAHYAVNDNGAGKVLVQLDDGSTQTRVTLTVVEATRLKNLLEIAIAKAMYQCFDNGAKSERHYSDWY